MSKVLFRFHESEKFIKHMGGFLIIIYQANFNDQYSKLAALELDDMVPVDDVTER